MSDLSPPTGPMANAAFLLSGLGRIVRDEIEADLHREGLSLRHLSALGHLSRQQDVSYSEMARRAGVTVQSMQATIAGLEDLGAIERTGASRHCSSRSPSGASWKPSPPFSV